MHFKRARKCVRILAVRIHGDTCHNAAGMDIDLVKQILIGIILRIHISQHTLKPVSYTHLQVLGAGQEDIRALAGLTAAVLDDGNLCVIGNDSKIEESRELFTEVKNLFR